MELKGKLLTVIRTLETIHSLESNKEIKKDFVTRLYYIQEEKLSSLVEYLSNILPKDILDKIKTITRLEVNFINKGISFDFTDNDKDAGRKITIEPPAMIYNYFDMEKENIKQDITTYHINVTQSDEHVYRQLTFTMKDDSEKIEVINILLDNIDSLIDKNSVCFPLTKTEVPKDVQLGDIIPKLIPCHLDVFKKFKKFIHYTLLIKEDSILWNDHLSFNIFLDIPNRNLSVSCYTPYGYSFDISFYIKQQIPGSLKTYEKYGTNAILGILVSSSYNYKTADEWTEGVGYNNPDIWYLVVDFLQALLENGAFGFAESGNEILDFIKIANSNAEIAKEEQRKEEETSF